MSIKIGLSGEAGIVVGQKDTAEAYGSGDLNVFATPALIALMENASMNAVKPYLAEGSTTVGTKIDISHIAATPIGMNIKAHSELIEIDGRKLIFKVQAHDELELISDGIHERFIVDAGRFLSKVEKKKER